MMSRSKKIVASMMAVCLAVTMTPTLNGVAYADELQTASITVQEFSNFEPNSALTEKDLAGITYDSKTKTITLNNVNLTKSLGGQDWFTISDSSVTINLVGNNKFVNKNGNELSSLFYGNNFTVTGSGSLTVSGMNCINSDGNINIKSGTINVNSPGSCLAAEKNINVDNKVKLSVVTNSKNTKYRFSNAVIAGKMTNSYKSLVKVSGGMPKGAEIKDKNALYKVIDDDNNVKLTKWLSGKSAKFSGDYEKVIMGAYYRIYSIGSNAFNNSAGKKLKKLTIYPDGDNSIKIEKYAFKGTKSLTDIYTRIGDLEYNNGLVQNHWVAFRQTFSEFWYLTTFHTLNFGQAYSKNKNINKLAFKGAGKSNGKKLTVHVLNHANVKYNGKMHKVCIGSNVGPHKIGSIATTNIVYSIAQKNSAIEFKKILKKYGINNKAKVVVPRSAVKLDKFRDRKADKKLGY